MHGHLPYLAKPKNKPREEARIAKHRRETMTRAVMRILDCGRSSKFEYEAAARHGLRSALCLEGWRWPEADRLAASIVEEGLRRIGAVRPTWAQAQPEWAQEGYAPIERYYCARCGTLIPIERRGGAKYCCSFCAQNAAAEKQRRSGERVSAAEYAARVAAQRERRFAEQTRPCKQCGKPFTSRDSTQRFCSYSCANAAKVVEKERRICPQCGAAFERDRWRDGIFCSQRCMGDAMMKPRPILTCAQCGNKFTPTKPDQQFCSHSCRGIASRKALPEFQCQQCGVVFEAKYTWAKPKFCSQACKSDSQRRQKPNAFVCEPVAAE